MCTVSWVHQEDGYSLLCNRDEKRSRPLALGPEVKIREGVRFISPTDAAASGTWIAVNECGISICLLNGHQHYKTQCELSSRGLLLPELISARSRAEVVERIEIVDLSQFASFTIVVLDPAKTATVVMWDGQTAREIASGDLCMPLISSSFDPGRVADARRREFLKRRIAAGTADERMLYDFHASHGACKSAYSTCMHRPDAATVSFSRVRVTGSEIAFTYSPGALCQSTVSEIQELTRIPRNSF